jgi:16S rRNA (cytidine1402-2'-O)-methyltransferase
MSTLTLVATPIGNLGDMSARAVEALTAAGLVCCEDTRRTGLLLKHFNVHATLMRVDDHTEHDSAPRVIDALNDGRDVCLVTDAGSPGISDPGARLVRAVIDAGHDVTAVPGPAALVMAITVSGLDSSRFVFEGFIPRSGGDRARRIDEISRERRTIVVYEAPHRLVRTLTDLSIALGVERPIAVCRELTKMHEEIRRCNIGEAVDHYTANDPQGEFVIVIAGAPPESEATDDDVDRLLAIEFAGDASTRDAANAVAAITGRSRKLVYERALKLRHP